MKASTIAGVIGALALGGVAIAQTSATTGTPGSNSDTNPRAGEGVGTATGVTTPGGPGAGGHTASTGNPREASGSMSSGAGSMDSGASSAGAYGSNTSGTSSTDTTSSSGATSAGSYGTDTAGAAGERG